MAGAVHGARAADAPPTRRWLRRRFVGAVVAIVVGAGLLVAGDVVRTTSSQPVRVGPDTRPATATVSAIRLLTNGRLGSTAHLVLAFRSADGVARTAEVDIGVPKPQYTPGVTVAVVYRATDPTDVQLEGVPENPPVPWPVPVGLGVVGLVAGALTIVRTRGTARILRDNPWVVARATLIEASQSRGVPRPIARFIELDGAPDDGTVLAGPLSARAVPDLVPDAWVAGSDRWFVVAAVGGAPLGRTRRARLRPAAASQRRTDRKPQSSR